MPAGEDARPGRLGRFDLVLCTSSLEHMADPEAVLARMAELVRPGGAVVLYMANPSHLRSLYDRLARSFGLNPPFRHLARRALQQRAQAVGLRPMKVADLAMPRGSWTLRRGALGRLASLAHVLSGNYVAVFTAETGARAVEPRRWGLRRWHGSRSSGLFRRALE